MKNFELIQAAIEYYNQEFKAQPSVGDVASAIGLSEAHFKRLFKSWAGVSPKKFLSVITAEFAKTKLEQSQTVLDTAFASGLSGQGRLYDHMINLYAMTPGEVKKGAPALEVHFGSSQSPFGEIIIFFSSRGISQLEFVESNELDHIARFQKRWPNTILKKNQKEAQSIVKDIFDSSSPTELKLHTLGTNFELNVWKALINIPSGNMASYGQIAHYIGRPTAHRAVANAIGRNPISILIPCHRVIRESGVIGGYRWGISRKLAIQAKEFLP